MMNIAYTSYFYFTEENLTQGHSRRIGLINVDSIVFCYQDIWCEEWLCDIES